MHIVDVLLKTGAYSVTRYLSPTHTMRAVRIGAKKKLDGRDKRVDIRVTIGSPNYLQRRFIKACKKAGEPFPVKKDQLRMPRGAK